eukprot:TRINITY_DN15999_c0_g1_i2.p1 TRINITY_DN15999_c0_g1~~TRINITY_DN15999_c0_g1_i2.p1  ORF type:complete len:208 (+),score=-13.08 TRINITY_DN15999_c0_g1_i2:162-785(+)
MSKSNCHKNKRKISVHITQQYLKLKKKLQTNLKKVIVVTQCTFKGGKSLFKLHNQCTLSSFKYNNNKYLQIISGLNELILHIFIVYTVFLKIISRNNFILDLTFLKNCQFFFSINSSKNINIKIVNKQIQLKQNHKPNLKYREITDRKQYQPNGTNSNFFCFSLYCYPQVCQKILHHLQCVFFFSCFEVCFSIIFIFVGSASQLLQT